MEWIDRAVQVFQWFGFIGALVALYTFARDKKPAAVIAGVICAIGALIPIYYLYLFKLPHFLVNLLVPFSKTGAIVSFLLNVGPWVYLLPAAIPPNMGKRGRRRRA